MTRAAGVPAYADAFVEALLPFATGDGLNELVSTAFVDAGVPVRLSGVDQLSIAFMQRLVDDVSLGGSGVLQLPRSTGDTPLLAAICLHLLLARRAFRPMGPVVFVSMDLDLTSRLKSISVLNRQRVGLASGNPLSAHRLRGDGSLSPLEGSVGPTNSAFVYFNPRVGAPPLQSPSPVVVIDGRTVQNPAMRSRVGSWAQQVGAATVLMVGDLGDGGLATTLTELGHVPTVVSFTPDVLAALRYNLGSREPAASALCSMHLLNASASKLRARVMSACTIDQLLREAYTALAARPSGEQPYELDRPLRLLRAGARLAASTASYDRACLNNPRPGEHPKTLRRRLERSEVRLSGAWRAWGSATWPRLTLAVESLWRELDDDNPKVAALWSALEEAVLESPEPIAVRCHSRAAAEAVLFDLSSSPDRTDVQLALWDEVAERTEVCRFADRFAPNSFGFQILTGAPAPWYLPTLLGAETRESVVLTYFPSSVKQVVEMEKAGLDTVWVAEAYSFDSISQIGYLAARTDTVEIGTSILNVYSRTPALMAMTAAGCDYVSGGRFHLGVGASGPQVIEGFHGVPYEKPMQRTIEYIEVCRNVWKREAPLEYHGQTVDVPLTAGGTGLGKALKIINHPVRPNIPIWWASLMTKSVEATAQHADGWQPLFFIPDRFRQVWGAALDAGLAKRDPGLPPLQIAAGGLVAIDESLVGEEQTKVLDRTRGHMALYVGGMGARGKNFYNTITQQYGFEAEAKEVQDLYLDGKKAEAAAALPAEMVEKTNLVGPKSYIAERLAAYREAGVTTLQVTMADDPVKTIDALRELLG